MRTDSVWSGIRAGGPWLAVLSLGVWAAWPGPVTLVTAALLGALALALDERRGTLRSLAMVVVLATVVAGFFHLDARRRVESNWSQEWLAEEEEIFGRLQAALDPILEGGMEAASRLAALGADGNVPAYPVLAELREEAGFHAVALFDDMGRLLVWDGDHRGRIPEVVALGAERFHYRDLPLAGILYTSEPVPGGGTAVVASLIRSDLPERVRRASGDFVTRFQEEAGVRIRIQPTERTPADEGVLDLTWEDRTLFSVVLEPVTEIERRRQLDRLANLWGLAGATLAWLLLALAPGLPQHWLAAGSGLALAAVLPTEALLPAAGVSDPAAFLLLGVPLVRWMAVLAAVGLAGGLLRSRPLLPTWASALLLALLFPILGAVWLRSVSADYLAGPEQSWLPVAVTLALGLTLGAWIVMSWSRRYEGDASPLRILLGWSLSISLPLASALAAGLTPGLTPWFLAVWGLPILVWGEPGLRYLRRRGALLWVVAGLLGSGAALPLMWGARIQARMTVAEVQVDRLGVREDPYLEFLLARLAFSADSLAAEGVRPVELLYGSWKRSGLAEASYPIWLTLWTQGGFPREDLPIGMADAIRPDAAYTLNNPPPGSGLRIRRYAEADAHYAVQVPLQDGRVVTGVIPPVQDVGKELLLGPLFGSLEEDRGPALSMIPLLPGDEAAPDTLVWSRTPAGWRGELSLVYPDETFQARFQVPLPGPAVALARSTLLLGIVLLLAGALKGAGLVLRGSPAPLIREAMGGVRSFRGRVTLALFGFFTISNVVFGTVAYRTITGASERAAQVLAERVVSEAGNSYLAEAGEIELLAQRVGGDLLEYEAGALREGALEPLVELGLYEGWVPYPVYASLTEREVITASAPTAIGDWAYVTAYRRLPDGNILSAPIPLEAGATAVRSREVIDLLGFTLVAGIALSIFLSVLVGRALARPIQALRVASERVGSGNLSMRLPEDRTDEFGTVFQAFNRMVRRLRRARRSLVRNTRRTQAIVEDAATGVVALDAQGVVTLANTRARTLLEAEVQEGHGLQEAGGAAEEVAGWAQRLVRDGLTEGGTEVQVGDRRLRVQARRITQEVPSASGVVLSIEDVTDELRSERILAWGEMARQVAHEVKNPLTPMKLSVQHLRRAWEDERPDFGEILDRNADAVLREIDRLAGIASGFSRFGAPGQARDPLEAVDLPAVVQDTLNLYTAGTGAVEFRVELDREVHPVHARGTEVKEVLVNLLENARAAIEGEGEVVVEVARAPEEGVVLRVRDNGTGIAPEVLSRVFEPHFSTRSAGTGLGLAIVKRVVESWGAAISISSTLGEGTVVEVLFPQDRDGAGVVSTGTFRQV